MSIDLPLDSISYLRDTSGALTINEVITTTSSFEKATSVNLGIKNGTYWFKIDGIEDSKAILELRSSHAKNIAVYDSNKLLIADIQDTRFPSYLLEKGQLDFPVYLKAYFPVEAYFPINISSESSYLKNEKKSLLGIGFFFGTGIALIAAILIFFFIVRNTQFLFFAFLVFAILLSIVTKDNILYLFGIKNDISISLELIGHYIVGISSSGFMLFYLKVRHYQLLIKWSMLGMSVLSTAFLTSYLITKNLTCFIAVDITSICTVILMWILMLMIAKGSRKVILIMVYTFDILFLVDYFILHTFNVSFIKYTPGQVAIVASFNFTLIAILLLVHFKNIQSKGVIMKNKIMLYIEELKELNNYKNIQDADDSYMESLIYQFKLENMEVRILNDISKGRSNEYIAQKHSLSEDKLRQITNSLYSKLGLDTSSDLQQFSF